MDKKYAIVTGASTGIGRAIAVELSKNGCTVYLVARSKNGLTETRELINKGGGESNVYKCDLSKPDDINKLITSLRADTNQVDVLVNVAGIWHGRDELYASRDFETFPVNVILDTYFVGLIAPSLLVHGLIPLMPKNGKIVNISGTFESGAKGWLPYFVSKKGIEDLTIGLAQELRNKDIQVNAVSPSDTATEAYRKYFPQYINEAVEPLEIAKQVAYSCSNKANDVTGKVFVVKKGKAPYEGYHT